jgi:hypothetical protein
MIYQSFGVSPQDFEKTHKKELAARKLNMLIASSIHVSDADSQQKYMDALATEKDPKKRKELQEKPQEFQRSLLDHEINLVFSDWLNQLNSNLKVNIVSDRFQKMLSGAPQ